MKRFLLILSLFFFATSSCFASRRAPNRPYVQSMADGGIFYARCIPDESEGTKGTTTIYRVGKETDEKIDTYNWYSPAGVVLAWSPIAGKVALMSLEERQRSKSDQVEFSFYLGGKFLRSYTTKQLEDLDIKPLPEGLKIVLQYKVLGVTQIPFGTNEYAFSVEISQVLRIRRGHEREDTQLYFNILTGEVRS